MIGLTGNAILGHISGQFLQTDDIEITERLYVPQYAGEIRTAIARFAVLYVPRKKSHLLDTGVHEGLDEFTLEYEEQYQQRANRD